MSTQETSFPPRPPTSLDEPPRCFSELIKFCSVPLTLFSEVRGNCQPLALSLSAHTHPGPESLRLPQRPRETRTSPQNGDLPLPTPVALTSLSTQVWSWGRCTTASHAGVPCFCRALKMPFQPTWLARGGLDCPMREPWLSQSISLQVSLLYVLGRGSLFFYCSYSLSPVSEAVLCVLTLS